MNITEFAAYAGVSKAAVSRYFNNGYLSADKRAAIEKACLLYTSDAADVCRRR